MMAFVGVGYLEGVIRGCQESGGRYHNSIRVVGEGLKKMIVSVTILESIGSIVV